MAEGGSSRKGKLSEHESSEMVDTKVTAVDVNKLESPGQTEEQPSTSDSVSGLVHVYNVDKAVVAPRPRKKSPEELDVEAAYREFLRTLIKLSPNDLKKLTTSSCSVYLETLSSILMEEHILADVKKDQRWSEKLLQFITTLTNKVLQDIPFIMDRPFKSHRFETEVKRFSEACFAAIANFFGAKFFTIIPLETFTPLVTFVKRYWMPEVVGSYHQRHPFSVLVNISTEQDVSEHFIKSGVINIENIVEASRKCQDGAPELFPILSALMNFSRSPLVQDKLMIIRAGSERQIDHIMCRFPFLTRRDCRAAIFGMLKNIAMGDRHHKDFAESDYLLTLAMLPLLGPGDYRQDELADMSEALRGEIDNPLQKRDEYFVVRQNCLEFLTRLCATRACREILRGKNIYCILREFYKWEMEDRLLEPTENLVNILIRTEDEIGADDLLKLTINDKTSESDDEPKSEEAPKSEDESPSAASSSKTD